MAGFLTGATEEATAGGGFLTGGGATAGLGAGLGAAVATGVVLGLETTGGGLLIATTGIVLSLDAGAANTGGLGLG